MGNLMRIGLVLLTAYSLASGNIGKFHKKKEIGVSIFPFPAHGELYESENNDTFNFHIPKYPFLPSIGGIPVNGLDAKIIFRGDGFAEYHQDVHDGAPLDTVLEEKYLFPIKSVPRHERASSIDELVRISEQDPLFSEGADVYASKFFHIKATLCLDENPIIEYKATFLNGKGGNNSVYLYAEFLREGCKVL